MNHEELLKLASGEGQTTVTLVPREKLTASLKAIVELHKPYGIDDYPKLKSYCTHCEHLQSEIWPCPTIQAIEKELQ